MHKRSSVFILAVMILASLSVLVHGLGQIKELTKGEHTVSYDMYMQLDKGWNLLLGVGTILETTTEIGYREGNLKPQSLRAFFVFIPTSQEYVRLAPKTEYDKLQNSGYTGGELIATPFWVYSNQEGYIRYITRPIMRIQYRQMYPGWNAVAITPEFLGTEFKHIFSQCEVTKAVYFNSKKNTWDPITNTTQFSEDQIGTGFMVKVKETCVLVPREYSSDTNTDQLPPPPTFPE